MGAGLAALATGPGDRGRMQGAGDYLGGLARLHRLNGEEQRTTWRQSMATLARLVAESPVLPLEGAPPDALLSSVQAAFAAGLVDDLGWLSESAGGMALYELASVLPDGAERRELGRRVLERLTGGDATTFVALATQLALGPSKILSGPAMRARVALALDLPIGAGAPADALALALISRRDLEREWLDGPSTGALPSRRLAARLLERAAREAVRRAAGGDDSGTRVFAGAQVQAASARLLADRESLVWRHVAAARGLLSVVVPSLAQELRRHLDPGLSPTEWRRAAASVAATVAFRPESALALGRRILAGKILRLDRGVAGAMILGLPRAAEAEPDAAEELLESCIAFGGVDAVEALVELRRERIGGGFGEAAAKMSRARVRDEMGTWNADDPDDGAAALYEALLADLMPEGERTERSLRDWLLGALDAFAEGGAAAAYSATGPALAAVEDALARLEGFREDHAIGRRRAFRALRELDMGLLETSTLSDLLMLGSRGPGAEAATAPLDGVFSRLTALLAESEAEPVSPERPVLHRTLRLRRLRAMLHLVDADGSASASRGPGLRERRLASARLLLRRVRDDAPSPLARTVCAAAARACDALVREEVVELSDVFLAAAGHLRASEQQSTMAEASMVPEIEALARAYGALCAELEVADGKAEAAPRVLRALHAVPEAMPVASSRRVEALRAAVLGLARALELVAAARCLTDLVECADLRPLQIVESAVRSLAQLVAGAGRRLGLEAASETSGSAAALRLVDFALERSVRGQGEALAEAVETARDILLDEIPEAMASTVVLVLRGIAALPSTAPVVAEGRTVPPGGPVAAAPLPVWLPPSRILGGFYVQRALGSGGAASVFVVRRVESRNDEEAEHLALKVPAYDGSAARSLSEAEFLQMFREEAGALLAVPAHPNLARFVTFDAGARPKPILVMELVDGPTLERVLAMADLGAEEAVELLDGVAAGLEAMHSVGVGHLDLKPSNVILRDPDGPGPEPRGPVLVDFGLSGRTLRPGCGTPEYAAPEIWGVSPEGVTPGPAAADVYAFGCLAYEVLTGRTLFDAETVGEVKQLHLAHDGVPPAVAALDASLETSPVARLLAATLRRDPRRRAPIGTVRAGLRELAPLLSGRSWPLGADRACGAAGAAPTSRST